MIQCYNSSMLQCFNAPRLPKSGSHLTKHMCSISEAYLDKACTLRYVIIWYSNTFGLNNLNINYYRVICSTLIWVQHLIIKPVLSWRDCSVKDSELVYWHKTNVRIGQSRLAPGPLPNENPVNCKRQKGQNVKVTRREAKNLGNRFIDAWFEISTISFYQQSSFLPFRAAPAH